MKKIFKLIPLKKLDIECFRTVWDEFGPDLGHPIVTLHYYKYRAFNSDRLSKSLFH